MDLQSLIKPVIEISHNAGDALMKFYKGEYKVDYKSTTTNAESIVTEADFASDKIIYEQLIRLTPDIKIVSEETIDTFKDMDLSNETYWCVDPLDGTAIFARHEDEFSVLIALIQNGKPVLGVNYAPALKKTYYAHLNNGAFVIENNETKNLEIKNPKTEKLTGLVYSIGEAENTDTLVKKFPIENIVLKNTALRDTSIAEGDFDLFCYAKEGAGEWDTAANEIILKEAGGFMCNQHGQDIKYGNPYQNRSSIVSLNHPDLVKYLK